MNTQVISPATRFHAMTVLCYAEQTGAAGSPLARAIRAAQYRDGFPHSYPPAEVAAATRFLALFASGVTPDAVAVAEMLAAVKS